MEIRICPECNKAFYALKETDTLVCHYCGFVIFDQRGKQRLVANFDFNFTLHGHKVRAKLKDYSETGARIVYKGRLLTEDTVLNLVIDELGIEATAKTMWSKRIAKDTYSYGLELLK
ncbi:MAG: hypothetical protein IME99_03625 [Proteobacteria bacterium]|nr:hypothetical protein [Pseudomonadota bacterium]